MLWEYESQGYYMHVVPADQDKATQLVGAHYGIVYDCKNYIL